MFLDTLTLRRQLKHYRGMQALAEVSPVNRLPVVISAGAGE